MASTVTLNGGPTGGLHGTTPPPTTPTSPSSGVAPPSPSTHHNHHHHRVESNSSFDSGQEESLLVSLPPGLLLHTPPGGGHGKKRRKQSRPVRIPADDKSLVGKNNGEDSKTTETDLEREEGGGTHPSSGPLNLTSEGLLPSAHEENNSSASSASSSACSRNKGDNEEDDEEASSARGPSTFSLFPRHPFTSLFPGNVSLFPQQVQSHGARGGGTPASSASSVGSNNSCGGGGGVSNNNGASLVVGSSGTSLGSLPPHRIFNPEAYCDLCNKEFCNKYFLKTHKANKHGVYSELSSPSTSTPNTPGGYPPPPPSILQSTSAPPVPSSSSSAALLQHHHQQQQLHQLGGSSSSAPGNLVLGLSPGTNQGTSNKGPPSSVLSALDFGPFQGSFGSSSVSGGGGGGGSGRKSFCELCQKEFCNKYFLKRHKAKIHGIQENPSSASSGRSNSSSTGSTQVTNNNSSSVASTSANNNSKRFPNGVESSGCNNNNNNSMRDNNGGGGKFPGGSSNTSGGVLPLGLESLGLEVVTKHLAEEAAGREEGEVMPGDDDEENSKGGGGGDGATSKNEGLLQCQFCFREFSSRTSLASHLAKKHRLLVPTSFPPFLLPFPGLFPGGGGGGGGLGGGNSAGGNEAVAALLGSESAAVAALAAGLLDSTNGGVGAPMRGGIRGDSSEGSFECEVCHRSFATRVLLRMHKSYFHPEEDMMMSEGRGGEEPSGANSDAEEMKDDDEECGGDLKGDGMSRSPKEERDADSDDLRRLQTMIMELNRVSSAGAMAWAPGGELNPASSSSSSTLCVICNKEFYSSFFLQQHIAHYHADVAVKSESPGGLSAHSSSTPTPTNNATNNNTPSSIGDGGVRIKVEPGHSGEIPSGNKSNNKIPLDNFPTGTTLKDRLCGGDSMNSQPQAFLGSFGGTSSPMLVGMDSSSSPATPFLAPGPKGSSVSSSTSTGGGVKVDGKRPSPSLSRSYCTICHKELCNKYFMRTHMLKMHGISIESSTGLGGVTCDICNKELCSKYFLKVHKQNTHGIVEDGPSPPAPPPTPPVVVGLPPPPSQPQQQQQHQQQQQLGLNLSTSSGESSPNVVSLSGSNNGVDGGIKDGEGRYFYHYSESCPFCGRRFRSSKWLKTHLTSDHGEEGREKWKAMEKALLLSGSNSSSSSSQSRKVPQGHQMRSQQVNVQQLHNKGGVKSPGGIKTSRNGDNKGPSSSSSLFKGHNLTRDGNRCGFCNFSSSDLETMKTHLLKEHSAHLTSNTSRLETAAMNAAALNAAALNAVAAAGGYPGAMHGGSSSVGSGGLHQGGWKEGGGGMDGGGSDPLSVILSKIDGASNKLYRCTYCPFTTSILVYLYAHERTHSSSSATPSSSDSFICPMCFHTFDQPESLQQHIIGHQMSGVLGGFFNPTGVPTSSSSVGNSSGRLGFPTSSSPGQEQVSPFLPLLNGSGTSGESLYWALKQNLRGGEEASAEPRNLNGDEDDNERGQKNSMLVTEEETDRPKKKKRFKCSLCNVICNGRDDLTSHMRKTHGKGHLFRCRKCKFTAATYPRLVVHSRVAHHHRVSNRGGGMTLMKSTGTGTEWKFPPNPMEEDFMMQGFFLTSSEEESSEDSPFVPSLVYLPVREKVSQSIRVSFSLTPT